MTGPDGYRHSHHVLVSHEEEARLVVLAETHHMTVPRLLVESTLSRTAELPTQRQRAMVDLFALERRLAEVSAQLERMSGRAVADVPALLGKVRATVDRIEIAIDGLAAE